MKIPNQTQIPRGSLVVLALAVALTAGCGGNSDDDNNMPIWGAVGNTNRSLNGTTWKTECWHRNGNGVVITLEFASSETMVDRTEEVWNGDASCSGPADTSDVTNHSISDSDNEILTGWIEDTNCNTGNAPMEVAGGGNLPTNPDWTKRNITIDGTEFDYSFVLDDSDWGNGNARMYYVLDGDGNDIEDYNCGISNEQSYAFNEAKPSKVYILQ